MEKVEYLQKFAEKHGLTVEINGEVGFGRECVGLLNPRGDAYVDYNPYSHADDMDIIEEFYIEAFYNTAPPNAYHKHDCLAVLGSGDAAINELYDWIVAIEALGTVVIREYPTGATGVQAMFLGTTGYCVYIQGD